MIRHGHPGPFPPSPHPILHPPTHHTQPIYQVRQPPLTSHPKPPTHHPTTHPSAKSGNQPGNRVSVPVLCRRVCRRTGEVTCEPALMSLASLRIIAAMPGAALKLPLSHTQGFRGASDKVTVYDDEDQLSGWVTGRGRFRFMDVGDCRWRKIARSGTRGQR